MVRIAITGSPGVGKSTLCQSVLNKLSCTYGGMMSGEIIMGGRRVGFDVQDISTSQRGILSHRNGVGPRVGSYYVNLDDLTNIGCNAIRNASIKDLVVIDEIGPMEFKSVDFVQAVEETLLSNQSMLVVLHQKTNYPLAETIRRNFQLYTVTVENRNDLIATIAETLNN